VKYLWEITTALLFALAWHRFGPPGWGDELLSCAQQLSKTCLAFGVLALSAPTAALAGDGVIDEIKLGFLTADTGIGGEKIEHGLDINGELLFVAPKWFISEQDPQWLKILLAVLIANQIRTYW
jgi:hypothetical protein